MTISELRAYSDRGKTLRDVVIATGVSMATICRRCKNHGVSFNKSLKWISRNEQEYEMTIGQLVSLFARDGYSVRLAAGAMGIAPRTLQTWADKNGIEFPCRRDQRKDCKGGKPRKYQ